MLDFILSDNNREEVVKKIHEYLRQLGEDIKESRIPLQKYVITKTLTKGSVNFLFI